ncbi:MAG: primosomal protein N' [Cytophagales bacterium]|nr:primosomal protein N' [Cytophagales bacterium]
MSVVLPTPAHSRLPEVLSYGHSAALPLGTLVRVPLGARELLGVVWAADAASADSPALATLKPITAVLDVPPLGKAWLDLIRFAARYYQRFAGELAMAALPPQLRELDAVQFARLLKKRAQFMSFPSPSSQEQAVDGQEATSVNMATRLRGNDGLIGKSAAVCELSPEQEQVLAQLQSADTRPKLLFGATGSGKTEVYLRRVEQVLADDAAAQALVMVPEINLTPQMEARFQARIEARFGAGTVVLMHSGMTPAQRTASWLSAHLGRARLVLGTRLAVLASMPHLRLIVVDEEHDPSYKSQDGARYSARDLAVYRGNSGNSGTSEAVQVILGSATPSIETWHNAVAVGNKPSRYQRLDMPSRIHAATMPKVVRVDMRLQQKSELMAGGLAPLLMAAITERAERGEQSLLFLNRRGYAPVLHCGSCEWKSACPHCSANQVFHKKDRRLRCHHCSLTTAVPRQCPLCGNLDIGMQGRGTEQLEELLIQQLGEKFRVLRLDADSTRTKDSLAAQMASVHAGQVDVLVGTQMVTKGHDFRRITLVAAVNPDSALFAADFRAPERLFSLLMQAAGRAGRDASMSGTAEMWLQTQHPTHPLYTALAAHDYPAFAQMQLVEREAAAMPPFSYQALLRAEGRTQELAQAFLDSAAAVVAQEPEFDLFRDPASKNYVTLYPAVPMPMQRIANVERAQMLVEATSRMALQRMLAMWQPHLRALKATGVLRWALDVDPLTI